MKIAWLAPYPVSNLKDDLSWSRWKPASHPCSWIVNLSQALVQHFDADLHLITLNPWVKRTQCVQKDGMTIHVIKNGIPFLNRGWPGKFPVDVWTRFAGDVKKLRKAVRLIQPDIIHAHGTENPYSMAAVSSGFPVMVSMQGIIAEICKVNPTMRFKIVQQLERKVLEQTKYVSCRTAFDTGFVRSINPKAHIFQIQEAMNPLYFDKQWNGCGRKRILFVGSMGKHKGLEYLLQAVKVLVDEDPEVELCVVGGGLVQIEACRQRCRELGIENQVEFAGFLNAEAIVPYHLSCRVFVIPSTNENSPNTLAEAMVSGMPCVASAVGGIPSMVDDGKTGLLFESGDADGLVRQLKRVLYDDEFCRQLGSAAAKVARKRHNPETVAEETLAAYHYVLENEQGG